MDYHQYIESKASILLGKPVVKGTRLTVELVLQKLSEGATTEQLVEAYPNLTAPAIQAVLAYASDMVAHETVIAVA